MSWIAAGLWLLLLVTGMPVGAEEFTVDVFRGSEIVRVTGDEGGQFREETLREDPTPEPPPRETEAPAPAESDDAEPTVRVIVESVETISPAGYVVVQPAARHHRRPYARPGHDRPARVRRAGYGRWSPPR